MNDESDDDRDWFRRQMRDVQPLKKTGTRAGRPRPPAEARFTRADQRAVMRESLESNPDEQQEFSYARPAVSRTVMRKLRRGRYSIGDELDLHGLNATAARIALDRFLAEAVRHGHSCVRIIHGKGKGSGKDGPVLKPRVARWLRQRDVVLAYTTARPVDGGSGALYVLLSRK